MRKGFLQIFGVKALLPHQQLAELIMTVAHKENHAGSASTLARSSHQAWLHHGRKLAQRMVNNCTICKMEKTRLMMQRMGQLPVERLETGCPPFSNICLDLLGPITV